MLAPVAASLTHNLAHLDISLAEKIVRSVLVFAFLVIALRLGGKRELGQVNMLDMAVLLLVSNALQNALIGNDNSLIGGFVGASVLFVANYLFVRLTYSSPAASVLLEGRPRVLLQNGKLQRDAMRREAITSDELHSLVMERGMRGFEDAKAIVLEPNGHLVVEPKQPKRRAKGGRAAAASA